MASFVRVSVETDYPLRFTRKYIMPQPALRARADLWLYDRTHRLIGNRPMPGRWSGSPQPTPPLATGKVQIGTQIGTLWLRQIDVNVLGAPSMLDIYPDAPETLDIAVGLDGHTMAYGWSNENYRGNWAWELPVGDSFVAIEIRAVWARSVLGVFVISNPGRHVDLAIRAASSAEEVRVRESLRR